MHSSDFAVPNAATPGERLVARVHVYNRAEMARRGRLGAARRWGARHGKLPAVDVAHFELDNEAAERLVAAYRLLREVAARLRPSLEAGEVRQ